MIHKEIYMFSSVNEIDYVRPKYCSRFPKYQLYAKMKSSSPGSLGPPLDPIFESIQSRLLNAFNRHCGLHRDPHCDPARCRK